MIDIRRLDKSLDYSKYDKIFMIVISMKNTSQYIEQMPELAPPSKLFKIHRKLLNEGQWNKKSFDEIYAPAFLSYIRHSPIAIDKLNELYNMDKQGLRICLLCYCSNEALCHRSIIAGILQGMGCNVQLASVENYSHYYMKLKFI